MNTDLVPSSLAADDDDGDGDDGDDHDDIDGDALG